MLFCIIKFEYIIMAQNSFRPYKGRWITKEHTLKASAGAVELGDLIMITSGGVTVELGTNAATAIVGIAAEDKANSASTQTLKVKEPSTPLCEMEGQVTDGAIAVGDTDAGRGADLEDHAGVDTDTDSNHHLVIVKGVVATADGATTAGKGIFRIAQTVDKISSF